MVVVVVVVVATTSTTFIIASTTTLLDHDWRSLMVHGLNAKKLGNKCNKLAGFSLATGSPKQIWHCIQHRPGGCTWATIAASFVQQETRKIKVVHFLTRHASTSAPGQNIVETLLSCLSLIELVCPVKPVWFHM